MRRSPRPLRFDDCVNVVASEILGASSVVVYSQALCTGARDSDVINQRKASGK